MTSVIDHSGNEIKLNDCRCGSEPTYWSKCGLAHEIVCEGCGRQTDMEICGLDAVYQWNAGKTFKSAAATPIRSQYLQNKEP